MNLVYFFLLIWTAFCQVTLYCHGDGPFVHCELFGDTIGEWVRTDQVDFSQTNAERHFILGPVKEAMNFSQIWLPRNCAYHRFTSKSILPVVTRALRDRKRPNGAFRIAIVGDSASRGIFCGLTRIFSGSELLGPCNNVVCGTSGSLPASYKHANKIFDVDFGPQLRVSFEYIYGLDNHHGDWALEFMIKTKPDVLIFNTGAWDFDKIARAHMNETAEVMCDSEEMLKVSQYRSSEHVYHILNELSTFAKEEKVRVIYRNNHYNNRFGALCADANFEKLVQKVGWEIWDNRELSRDVWKNQTYDGFHFDRHKVHSTQHHLQIIQYNREMKYDLAGQLEIQLAQSLLNAVFHKELRRIYNENPNIDLNN